MRNMLKTTLIVATVLTAVGLGQPKTASAQFAVTCVNCSTTWTQLMEYGKQLQQVETQLQSYSTQLSQYANMVQNTTAVPQQIYSNAMGDMQRVQGLMAQGSQLSFSNLGSSMGTFSSFLTNAKNIPADLTYQANQYSVWSNRAKDGIKAAMGAISTQNAQISTDNVTMQQLQVQAGASTGQMQAMQNSAEIAAQGVRETEKLRQLVMVQIQLEANKQSVQSEQTAQEQASWQNFVSQPMPSMAATKY